MSTKEAKQMDQALFDFYGKPSIGQALPLAIQHVLAMIVGCVTPSIICRCGRAFTGRFRYFNTGCTGDVGTDYIIAVISFYKDKKFPHRIGASGDDGNQFRICSEYAGNRSRF